MQLATWIASDAIAVLGGVDLTTGKRFVPADLGAATDAVQRVRAMGRARDLAVRGKGYTAQIRDAAKAVRFVASLSTERILGSRAEILLSLLQDYRVPGDWLAVDGDWLEDRLARWSRGLTGGTNGRPGTARIVMDLAPRAGAFGIEKGPPFDVPEDSDLRRIVRRALKNMPT